MPALKKGAASAKAAGAAGGSGSGDAPSETEWLEGMATLVGWMYEHCSRYQLDEACQGLIQSAERRLNLAHDRIMVKSDPYSQLKRWLSTSKYTAALQEFEFICPQQMDRSPDSVFTKTLNSIKIQIALSALRGSSQDIEEFKSQVNQLFPTKKKMTAAEAKMVDLIRSELLAVTKITSATGVLNKYSAEKFKEVVDEFWEELKKYRAATMLETVLSDVSAGTYEPRVALRAGAERPEPDEQEESVGTSMQEPAAASEESTQPVQKPPAAAAEGGAAPAAAAPAAKEGPPMVLSAWDLRRVLKDAGDTNDEGDFAEIHQQTHPDVVEFLARRKRGRRAQAKQPAAQPSEPEPQAAKRKRVRGAEAEEEEEEEEEEAGGSDVAAVAALLESKRKKQGGGAARGGKGGAGAKAVRENEKENEEPAEAAPEDSKGKMTRTRNSESHEVVRQLRENQRKLMSSTRDPLEEVRKISKTATHTADQNGAKRIRLSADSPGQKVNWDSDDGSGDEQRMVLPSPKNLSYKPRARLSRGEGGSASPAGKASKASSSKQGKERIRWSPEEIQNLKDGVRSCGEGNWKRIMEEKKFHKNRSTVDLKDKWRNLHK